MLLVAISLLLAGCGGSFSAGIFGEGEMMQIDFSTEQRNLIEWQVKK